MSYAAVPGAPFVLIGPSNWLRQQPPNPVTSVTLDAANEAVILIGRVVTSDGGSHTIDTSGSSSVQWKAGGTVTFANAGTTVKVGIAAVDAATGPPGRAANASDVITFDVNSAHVGGGGAISSSAWVSSVPTAGTKTIANGDLVAMCIQMTARGGADSVQVASMSSEATFHRPTHTTFTGGSYASVNNFPPFVISFADGALGYIQATDVFSTLNTRTFNSGSATKEYGQLYQFPFPMKVYGLYGFIDADNNCDIILYSDPLGGSPVAEKTVTIDSNTVAGTAGRRFFEQFASPYSVNANQAIGAVFKPGASNASAYFKTLDSAAHRIADVWGTSGYGISRASGAFADANSSLDHYYIGLIVGAFDDATGGSSTGVSRARAFSGFA